MPNERKENEIEKYVREHKLDKVKLSCKELEEIAKECKCEIVDVMSWFRWRTIL